MQIVGEQGADAGKNITFLDVVRLGKQKAKATYPLNRYSITRSVPVLR